MSWTSEFLFLGTRGAAADEAGSSSAMKGNPVAAVEQAVCMGVRNLRALTRVSLRPIPQWAALEGCTTVALMAEHEDAEQASGQCARVCGVLTRVRRACLWRASGRALRLFLRAVPKQGAARVDSVTSQCVVPPLPRRRLSMLTRCARLHWPRTVKVVALSKLLSP